MTPDEIEQLFSSNPPPLSGSAGKEEGEDTPLRESEQSQRTEELGRVLATARHLWETGSKDLDTVAEKIGNGARNGSWRIPLGESGLLDLFIEIIGTDELRKPLVVHALRTIGNSCADTDQNRERVVAAESLSKIVRLLKDDSLLPLVIPVLYNICVDYAGLNPELISLLSGSRLQHAEAFMGLICKLLRLVAGQEPESDLTHPDTPYTLLSLAAAGKGGSEEEEEESSPPSTKDDDDNDDDDLEDFLGQASVALTYLAHTQFQDSFLAKPNAAALFLRVFSRACGEFGAMATAATAHLDDEDRAQLKKTQSVFMQVLADLSAHPAFAAACPLDGPEVATLRRWIANATTASSSTPATVPISKSTPTPPPPSHAQQLRGAAACLALGNVARSDAACTSLVSGVEVHKPLIAILSASLSSLHKTDSNRGENSTPTPRTDAEQQLLYAALGILKNLAIPAANKAVLGGAGLLESGSGSGGDEAAAAAEEEEEEAILPRLWQISAQPQVQFAAVSLARLLLVGCAENARRVCAARGSGGGGRTHLQVLLGVGRETDQEPTRTEAARAALSVCRALHAPTGGPSVAPDRGAEKVREFYERHADSGLADALLFLGAQKKYPLLRSELWFVLALMARSSSSSSSTTTEAGAGAAVVAGLLRQHRELLAALSEAVTGKNVLEEAYDITDADADADAESTTAADGPSGAQPQAGSVISVGGSGNGGGVSELGLEPQQVDPKQAASMAKVDRENGLVLINELMGQPSDVTSLLPIDTLRRILKEGGDLVLASRDNKA
ncbi:hypothetical protein SLS62_007282 [Diatrype stigma]|uniref:Uncharacterized protein n=1 Tax=Diatrype stigma TaxID=117547 RepID=A0AAN9UMW1_9PEZI